MNHIIEKSVLCALFCAFVFLSTPVFGQAIDPPCPMNFQVEIVPPVGGSIFVYTGADCVLDNGSCEAGSTSHVLWFDQSVDIGCGGVVAGTCKCVTEVDPIATRRVENGEARGGAAGDGKIDLEISPKSRTVFREGQKNYLAYFHDDKGTLDVGDDEYYLGMMFQPNGGTEDSFGSAIKLNAMPRVFPGGDEYPPARLEKVTRDGDKLVFDDHEFGVVQIDEE